MSEKTHRNRGPLRRSLLAPVTVLMLAVTVAASACVSNSSGQQNMVLATTTSTHDSGLLDLLIPKFDSKFNVKTKILSVGTGQALAYGQSGDADVLLVHSRAREIEFVNKGYGLWRNDVMYNWFILVGPPQDPAGIGAKNDSLEAFRAIAAAGARFCTRGDASGTNIRELDLWKKSGLGPDPRTDAWYLNLSQGMGETLTTCNEKKAYTLSDTATWWSMVDNLPNLRILVKDDLANLKNQYGVIPVNGSNGQHVNTRLGVKFADWITSPDTQQVIAQYKRHDQELFFPNAG